MNKVINIFEFCSWCIDESWKVTLDALEKITKWHNTSTEKGDNYRHRKHAMRNRLPFKVDQMSNQ